MLTCITVSVTVAAVPLAPLVRKWVSTANPDRANGPAAEGVRMGRPSGTAANVSATFRGSLAT
jgi:hypothetical protein